MEKEIREILEEFTKKLNVKVSYKRKKSVKFDQVFDMHCYKYNDVEYCTSSINDFVRSLRLKIREDLNLKHQLRFLRNIKNDFFKKMGS